MADDIDPINHGVASTVTTTASETAKTVAKTFAGIVAVAAAVAGVVALAGAVLIGVTAIGSLMTAAAIGATIGGVAAIGGMFVPWVAPILVGASGAFGIFKGVAKVGAEHQAYKDQDLQQEAYMAGAQDAHNYLMQQMAGKTAAKPIHGPRSAAIVAEQSAAAATPGTPPMG